MKFKYKRRWWHRCNFRPFSVITRGVTVSYLPRIFASTLGSNFIKEILQISSRDKQSFLIYNRKIFSHSILLKWTETSPKTHARIRWVTLNPAAKKYKTWLTAGQYTTLGFVPRRKQQRWRDRLECRCKISKSYIEMTGITLVYPVQFSPQ